MPLVSKSEAARLAGVTRQTIHRKVKSGELSATGNSIDTSELIRVFGAISDGTEPVTPMSQPDVAVQTTLQARVDGLESQLAVTREQLADTAKDRDEWRDIAKEATSNVKLITNQGGGAKSNDNLMAFAAVAFVVGIGVAYMMLRNDVTPSDAMPLPAPVEAQSETPIPLSHTDDFKRALFTDMTEDVLENHYSENLEVSLNCILNSHDKPEECYEVMLTARSEIDALKTNEYAEFIPPPAQVPRTVCSIYDINPFSKYNDGECAIGAIYTKLGKQTELTPTEELASRCLNDSLRGDEWIAAKCPEAILELADMYQVELHPNELSGKPE